MMSKLRQIKHLFEYAGVLFLACLATWLPFPVLQKIGRGLGWFAFHVVRIRRGVTMDNLQRAFPEKSPMEIVRLAESTYRQFGMMMLETLRLLTIEPEEVQRLIEVETYRALDDARAAGRGAILLTGHMGNWEYLGAWVAINGYSTAFMFQEQANPYVNRLIRQYRERMGMDVVPRGMALRSYMKALREGRFVAAVADQDAGKNGVMVSFMGKLASTATGPARFALKTGAPIIFAISYRDPSGRLKGRFEPLDVQIQAGEDSEAIRQIMEAYNRQMETWIRTYPDQWFWMHRRWKTQPESNRQSQSATAMSVTS
ncbi:MAG: lysophospholipid acyltransferase family protein [candidate division KSB1 bacterium]|nr:lysophospholipid acyltransferase family protein [candidate division KSB1 bacterium]